MFDTIAAINDLENKIGKIDPICKILLVYDGTLEYILSVISNNIRFEVIKQIEYEQYIEREVRLEGRFIINATSIIYKDALPSKALDAIRDRRHGIGKILREYRMETFRDIIEIGFDETLYRIYDIIHREKIAFRIREDILCK